MRIEIVGGPLDGLVKHITSDPAFVFVSPVKPHKVFAVAAEGRMMHRLVSRTVEKRVDGQEVQAYLYAGWTHRLCGGCGCMHVKARTCQLCGAAL